MSGSTVGTQPQMPVGTAYTMFSDSPIQFFVSRYAIALIVMHVCTPFGRPARISPLERVLLRIPAILMLSYALCGLVQALCADTHTASAQAWLAYVRPFVPASTKPVPSDSLLWTAFLAACVAQCVGTAVRSLELTSSYDDPSTFNLVGFAFILYIHSYARDFTPNAHVYLIVIARTVELLGMNVLLCRRPPLVSRLVFTMVLGLCMTAHYLFTAMYTDEYPIIHSGGRLMEVCIMGIILLTLALHAMTMYFVDGSIDFRRLVFHRSNLPRSTDDFSLAVLKLGTACLHATKLTGLSCELQTLDAPLRTYVELHSDGRTVIENSVEDYEKMELEGLNAFGKEIRDVRVVTDHDGVEMGGVVRGIDKMRGLTTFFGTLLEILTTLVSELLAYLVRFLPAPLAWLRHLPRYLRLFWHGTNGEAARAARLASEAARRAEAKQAHARMEELKKRHEARRLRRSSASSASGAVHDDLDPMELVALAEEEQGNALTLFQDVMVKHMLRPDQAPPLTRGAYRHIAAQAPTQDSWLTTLSERAGLLRDSADRNTQQALLRLLQERREALQARTSNDLDRERVRLCVVCCCEERTVICWPCRCVALCDSCRGTLASQQHAMLALHGASTRSTQLCPTCRAPVAAFSRLYLP